MHRLGQLVLAVAVLALTASAAQAQRGGGRGGMDGMSPLMLLYSKSVQEELKLTPEQLKQLEEAQKKQFEAFRGIGQLSEEERIKKFQELNKEGNKTVHEILKPEQTKRLHEIALQHQGPRAITHPDHGEKLSKELKLSDDQKKQIHDIYEEVGKEARAAFQGAGGDRAAGQKKAAELMKAAHEKVMGLLSDEQKAKWKELEGEKFKGEIERPGPRRRPAAPPEK
jgi:Spy/CpxP family protein refolding chaperone